MTGIFINYNPFSLYSSVQYIVDGNVVKKEAVSSTPPIMANFIFTAANDLNISTGNPDIKVFLQGGAVFYDELTKLVQTQQKNYSNFKIIMEHVE